MPLGGRLLYFAFSLGARSSCLWCRGLVTSYKYTDLKSRKVENFKVVDILHIIIIGRLLTLVKENCTVFKGFFFYTARPSQMSAKYMSPSYGDLADRQINGFTVWKKKSVNVAPLTALFFFFNAIRTVSECRSLLLALKRFLKYFPLSGLLLSCARKRQYRDALTRKPIAAYALRNQAIMTNSKKKSARMVDVNKISSLTYLPCWSWRYLKGNAEYLYKEQCRCSFIVFA